MFASFASIGLNLILNISLMRVLGFLAFPLSTTIAAVVNIVLLVWLLPRKIGRIDLMPVMRLFLALAGRLCDRGIRGLAPQPFPLRADGAFVLGPAGERGRQRLRCAGNLLCSSDGLRGQGSQGIL